MCQRQSIPVPFPKHQTYHSFITFLCCHVNLGRLSMLEMAEAKAARHNSFLDKLSNCHEVLDLSIQTAVCACLRPTPVILEIVWLRWTTIFLFFIKEVSSRHARPVRSRATHTSAMYDTVEKNVAAQTKSKTLCVGCVASCRPVVW